MHLKPRHAIKVVKKEEKEAQLKAFIVADLENRKGGSKASQSSYLLIARSVESPVMRALTSLSAELFQAGVTVKVILSAIDQPDANLGSGSISEDTRLATDPRLFDAHEQLVLSNNRVWIGDVMRREPAKRDAYENYCENCKKTSRWAKLAFDRLWLATRNSPVITMTSRDPAATDENFAALAAATGEAGFETATWGTRH